MGDKLCTVNGLTENLSKHQSFLFFLFFPPRRRKGEINFKYIPRHQRSLDAPVRAQGLPGHVRPSQNSTAPSSCAFIFKTYEIGKIFGAESGKEGASMSHKPGHALQMSHAKPTTGVLPNTFIVFTWKHRAHALHSSASPRRAGEELSALRTRKVRATPALPWTSPGGTSSFTCPLSLGKAQCQQCPSVRAWGCPWSRHSSVSMREITFSYEHL